MDSGVPFEPYFRSARKALSTAESRARLRKALELHTQEFLASGGRITACPTFSSVRELASFETLKKRTFTLNWDEAYARAHSVDQPGVRN